jgi:hypothetical protein
MRNIYNILLGKPERKRSIRKPRRRWKDDIRIDLRGMGWEGVCWFHLAQDRDQSRALYLVS